jgi:hypothetical protein
MWRWKLYSIVIISLFLLFIAITACSQPPAAIESPPQKPAEFLVGPITSEPPVVMVGDTVSIDAPVNNTGDLAGTYTAVLLLDGRETGRKEITVNPGNSQAVSFQLTQTAAGIYQLAIGNSSAALTVHNWSPYTIQYDNSDGAVVGAYVDGERGHIVHFTPPDRAFKIEKITIFAAAKIKDNSELNNLVTFRIWDKDSNKLLWSQDFPWSLFLSGTWQDIKVPDVRVNDDFQVEVVTHSNAQGDPIDFVSMTGLTPVINDESVNLFMITGAVQGSVLSAVLIGLDYPKTYLESPSPLNRPQTRSGYSYMGQLFEPGPKRFVGMNWLIRVEGEGAAGN